MRRLILNADDYAMDEGVDQAILSLIARNVVTATSAMVLSPRWTVAAGEIRQMDADCGLHLDLTSEFAATTKLTSRSLSGLIARSYAGSLEAGVIRGVIEAQLDLFESALDRPPDFVDGHQHVHQLPAIRSELMGALQRRYGVDAAKIGIRICLARHWRGAKARLIGALGGAATAKLARRLGHPVNSDFLGVYGFSPEADLPLLWRQWLAGMQGDMPLAMCHVATASSGSAIADPIRPARVKELAWLASDTFRDLCTELSVSLNRWPRHGSL
jgi:predicted glycoside hydrolase/deacetylase ChbG (UPF0249 family)